MTDPTPAPAEAVAFHIDQLARVIRNEEYPEFKAAPPPDWAVRAAHRIIEFHQGLVLEGVLAADRERYRHGWCCDYDFDNECPAGCGCRLWTDDADGRDCGCDGPCWWFSWDDFMRDVVEHPDEYRRLLEARAENTSGSSPDTAQRPGGENL